MLRPLTGAGRTPTDGLTTKDGFTAKKWKIHETTATCVYTVTRIGTLVHISARPVRELWRGEMLRSEKWGGPLKGTKLQKVFTEGEFPRLDCDIRALHTCIERSQSEGSLTICFSKWLVYKYIREIFEFSEGIQGGVFAFSFGGVLLRILGGALGFRGGSDSCQVRLCYMSSCQNKEINFF